MHYRRMEPQPARGSTLKQQMIQGKLWHVWNRPGLDAYDQPPDDMPGTQPWRDRRGEWYWRASPRPHSEGGVT